MPKMPNAKKVCANSCKKITITKCQLLIVNINCRKTLSVITKTITVKPPYGQ